jgi:hypothetical protein
MGAAHFPRVREAARVFALSRNAIFKMCRYSAPYVRSKPPERPVTRFSLLW